MQGKTRYFRHSHISDAKFRAIMHYFAHDLSASKIAELSGVSRATINQLFMKLRIRIAQVWNASSALSGEVLKPINLILAHAVFAEKVARSRR